MMFLYQFLEIVFQGLYLALFIRVILSWFPHNRYHSAIQFLHRMTDPMLLPFQRLMPAQNMGMDISPIFAFIALGFAQKILYRLLF